MMAIKPVEIKIDVNNVIVKIRVKIEEDEY